MKETEVRAGYYCAKVVEIDERKVKGINYLVLKLIVRSNRGNIKMEKLFKYDQTADALVEFLNSFEAITADNMIDDEKILHTLFEVRISPDWYRNEMRVNYIQPIFKGEDDGQDQVRRDNKKEDKQYLDNEDDQEDEQYLDNEGDQEDEQYLDNEDDQEDELHLDDEDDLTDEYEEEAI